MHTRFEFVLHGDADPGLRAAGEEALDEIESLEAQLSLFRPTSEIARVNRHAHERPVKVSPPTFHLLALARELSRQTEGAFDPTVGPLLRAWGFLGGDGALPDPRALETARRCVGMDKVQLDANDFTVRFDRPGLMLDLGAIGKGYAIDCAVALLRDAGVSSALIHGGTSSVYGLGTQPDGPPWKTAILAPESASKPAPSHPTDPSNLLVELTLTDAALGVSAVSGKAFQAGDRRYGHVLDPRTGEPVQRAVLAAVALPDATAADALSTALLVLGSPGLEILARHHPTLRAWLVLPELDAPDGYRILVHEPASPPARERCNHRSAASADPRTVPPTPNPPNP